MKSVDGVTNGKPTVLVVDDNDDDALLVRIAAQEACPEIGFRFVGSGREALAYLKGEDGFADRRAHPLPKVVVLDVGLPQMDGFEVLEQLREVRGGDGLKVVLFSGRAEPWVRERAEAAGAEFLAKPFSYEQMVAEVRRLCALADGDGETLKR